MEIVDYDTNQVINLMNVFRPQGAGYIPEIAAKVIAKYQFAKPPSIDDLTKDSIKFQIGKFNDVMISEFGVYNDGVIATGKCPTEVLEDFIKDVLAFAQQELKFVPVLQKRNEIHFESKLLVKTDADLAAFLEPKAGNLIREAIEKKIGLTYQSSGIVLDCDVDAIKTRRKPARVFIERRVGLKFEDNIFLCIAPLRTKDHLELLTALEQAALERVKSP